MNDHKLLKERCDKRWHSHKKRSIQHEIEPPKREDFWNLLLESYNNGFKCEYCRKQLKIIDEIPYKDVFSFDHDISLFAEGSNDMSNFVICCHECNIIKGILQGGTFKKILQELSPETWNEVKLDWWSSRMAEKLNRLEHVD